MRPLGESEIMSFLLGVAIGASAVYAARTVRIERHPLSGGRGIIRVEPEPRFDANAIDCRNEPRRRIH